MIAIYSNVLDDIWADFHFYKMHIVLHTFLQIVIKVVSGVDPPNVIVTAMLALVSG